MHGWAAGSGLAGAGARRGAVASGYGGGAKLLQLRMSFLSRLFTKKAPKEDMFKNITRGVNPTTQWTVLSLLGEGTFGKVHKVRPPSTRWLHVMRMWSLMLCVLFRQGFLFRDEARICGWKRTPNLGFRCLSHAQVENIETKEVAAAKVIPVKYEEEIEDFVTEVWRRDRARRPSHAGGHPDGLPPPVHHQTLWRILLQQGALGSQRASLSANDAVQVLMEVCKGGALDDLLLGAAPRVHHVLSQRRPRGGVHRAADPLHYVPSRHGAVTC